MTTDPSATPQNTPQSETPATAKPAQPILATPAEPAPTQKSASTPPSTPDTKPTEDDKLSPAAIVGMVVVTAALIVGVYFFVTGDGKTASLTQNSTVAGATASSTGTPADVNAGTKLANGNAAPSFDLKDHNGNGVSLASLKGAPTMIVFEATWCTFCQRENADIERIKNEYGRKLQVVTIDMREDVATVQQSVNARGITRPFLIDADGAVGTAYAVTGTPTHYFLDADGNIQAHKVGLQTYEQLKQTIDAII